MSSVNTEKTLKECVVRALGRYRGWKRSQIEAEKRSVKAELDAALPQGPKARLRLALTRIADLEEESTPRSQLRRYVYAMSALVHHERAGGLSFVQVERLAALAGAILATQGVGHTSSELSFLFGDIHLILSQIARRSGESWKAAWEQQLSFHLSQRSPSGGNGYQALWMGICALRLGYGELGLAEVERSLNLALPEPLVPRARLEMVRALRLKGDFAECDKKIKEFLGQHLTPEFRRELQWEAYSLAACEKNEVSGLIEAVRKKGGHHEYAYAIEAFLWTRAVESREWVERFPTLRALLRNPKAKPAKSFSVKCIRTFESLYDFQIPLIRRLESLTRLLGELGNLSTVDQELLVLAAATRWLMRSRATALALLVAERYRALSRSLSSGKTDDILGSLPSSLPKTAEVQLEPKLRAPRASKLKAA